jgi:SurA N-terminal domain/PPIC-type PPIASE domain
MISSLRRQAQQGNLKFFLWLVLFSMVGGVVVLLIEPLRRSSRGAVDIATVNGLKISLPEFRRRFLYIENIIANIRQLYGDQSSLFAGLNGKQMALDNLIQEKLLQSASDKLGIKVSSEYAENKLKDQSFVQQNLASVIPPNVMDNGVISLTLLNKYLTYMGITEQEFETQIEQALARSLFIELAKATVYIPDIAVKEYYNKQFRKKRFASLTLDLDDYLKKVDASSINDTEIKTYFDAHKDQYRVPEKRKALLWTFEPEKYGITIEEKDIDNYYTNNKKNFITVPEQVTIKLLSFGSDRKKAQQAAEDFSKHPEKFDAATKESAPIAIQRGRAKDFGLEVAAFSLAGKNALSPVVQTKEGFALIKLIDKKEPTYKDIHEATKEIKEKLIQEKFKKLFASDAQRIIGQAIDTPDIFNSFIVNKNGIKTQTDALENNGSLSASKIFKISAEKGKTFYVEKGKGYIAELVAIDKSFIPDMKEVKDHIIEDIKIERARAMLEADLKKIQKATGDIKERAQVLSKDIHPLIESFDLINSESRGKQRDLLNAKISLDRLLSLDQIGNSLYNVKDKKGSILILVEQEAFDNKVFNEKKNEIKQQLYQEAYPTVLPEVEKALKETAHIVINNNILQTMSK